MRVGGLLHIEPVRTAQSTVAAVILMHDHRRSPSVKLSLEVRRSWRGEASDFSADGSNFQRNSNMTQLKINGPGPPKKDNLLWLWPERSARKQKHLQYAGYFFFFRFSTLTKKDYTRLTKHNLCFGGELPQHRPHSIKVRGLHEASGYPHRSVATFT